MRSLQGMGPCRTQTFMCMWPKTLIMSSDSETERERVGFIAWNGYEADDVGVLWCWIDENKPFYRISQGDPTKGQSPWYLAYFKHHLDENGEIDMKQAWARADKIARDYNEKNGYSREDCSRIVAESMRLSRVEPI